MGQVTGRHSVEAAIARMPGIFVVWNIDGFSRLLYEGEDPARIAEYATTASAALFRASGGSTLEDAEKISNHDSGRLTCPCSDEQVPPGVSGAEELTSLGLEPCRAHGRWCALGPDGWCRA